MNPSSPSPAKPLQIGEWRVAPADGTLVRGDTTRRVQPRVMEVLLALAARQGEVVGRDELLRAVWGERAVSDEPLTRCIAELRSAFDDKPSHPRYIETLPKRGYRLIAPVSRASEDPARASPALGGRTAPEPRRAPRGPWVAGAIIFLALVAAGLWWTNHPTTAPPGGPVTTVPGEGADAAPTTPGDRSIAVLAFADLSPDGDQQWFSDGIAAELLGLLATLPDIRVISRSSSFSYKDKDVRLDQIAEELGVGYLLEGTVRKAGDRLRITAQLIDARTDSPVWSRTYDRTLEDVFAIQEAIATDVAGNLHVSLLRGGPSMRRTDPAAYALYLRGNELGRAHNEAALLESTALFQQVLEIDPDYAPAWSGLAVNAVNSANLGLIGADEMLARASMAVGRALEADADFAPAHAISGWLARREGDLTAAAAHYERALELDPVALNTLNGTAVLLTALGRVDEAVAVQESMVRRNPLNARAHFNLGLALQRSGRHEQAIAAFRKSLALNPDQGAAHYSRGVSQLLMENAEAALAAFEREPSEIWRLLGLPMAYHALGRDAESDAAMAELVERYGDLAAYNIAYVHAVRGEPDQAFAWLELELERSGPGMPAIVAEPLFGNLRNDERWAPFLARIGKSPTQLAAIGFTPDIPD